MSRPRQVTAISVLVGAAVLALGCGSESTKVDDRGAVLFAERCGACHTFEAAGTEGTIVGTRPTGPDFDKRRETAEQVLFAIRNGGFSGGIMPQNIAVGEDADVLAEFVAKYAGREAESAPSPKSVDGGVELESSPKKNDKTKE